MMKRAPFFLTGIGVQGNEGGGRILLDDNTGGGAVTLRPLRFQWVGVWISTGLPCTVHTYIFDHMCRQFRLPRKWSLSAGRAPIDNSDVNKRLWPI